MERLFQAQLITTFIAFSWLAMQAIHELGHVLLAYVTGGEVIKVALHPLILSRTDLGLNPHPSAVVWGGPVVGSALPALVWLLAAWRQFPGIYLFRFFAGFCLIANGLYIGIGSFLANGADPGVMLEHGSPRWVLICFGLLTSPLGLYLWHRQGRYFGLGESKGKVNHRAAFVSMVLLLSITVVELIYAGMTNFE
jgi:hypothetical protein